MTTLEEKIEVMTASKNGQPVQCCLLYGPSAGIWEDIVNPSWDWGQLEYRIKPVSKEYTEGFAAGLRAAEAAAQRYIDGMILAGPDENSDAILALRSHIKDLKRIADEK